MIHKVETWVDNPVLGDLKVEALYTDYQDFTGVKFPTTIINKQDGRNTLILVVNEVKPNAAVTIQAPPARPRLPPRRRLSPCSPRKWRNGIFYLMGGSHHSVAVEFADHIAVIEAPQSEARSLAVIREVRKAVGRKPIRYLINTHHHFDHSGGLRTYVEAGATIVTHDVNKAFYERVLRPTAPRTLEARSPRAREEGAGPQDRNRRRQESHVGQDPHARAAPDRGQSAQRRHPDGVPAGREDLDRGRPLHAACCRGEAARRGQPEHDEPPREYRASRSSTSTRFSRFTDQVWPRRQTCTRFAGKPLPARGRKLKLPADFARFPRRAVIRTWCELSHAGTSAALAREPWPQKGLARLTSPQVTIVTGRTAGGHEHRGPYRCE